MMKRTAVLLLLLLSLPAFARRHHRRVPEFRAFPPTADSLLLQNAEANREHLPRIQNDNELRELIGDGELARFVPGPALVVHIPDGRAYARPWVVNFISSVAGDYYQTFGKPLQINSAVRTVRFQHRLRRYNRNAAPDKGERASVHPVGIAVDVQRRGLTRQQRQWLYFRLGYWQAMSKVIVEEELRSPCFHVVVRREPPELSPNVFGLLLGQLDSLPAQASE